jgi:hypothetical protein
MAYNASDVDEIPPKLIQNPAITSLVVGDTYLLSDLFEYVPGPYPMADVFAEVYDQDGPGLQDSILSYSGTQQYPPSPSSGSFLEEIIRTPYSESGSFNDFYSTTVTINHVGPYGNITLDLELNYWFYIDDSINGGDDNYNEPYQQFTWSPTNQLFTTAADVVDFNNLTPAQKAAILARPISTRASEG